MLFIIRNKYFKLSNIKDFDLITRIQKLKYYEDDNFLYLDGKKYEYIPRQGNKLLKYIGYSDRSFNTRQIGKLYEFKYGPKFKLYFVNGKPFCVIGNEHIRNTFNTYIQNPDIFPLIMAIPFKYRKLPNLRSLNTVYGLQNIRDLTPSKILFVTTKLDGIGTVVGFIKNYGVICITLNKELLYTNKQIHIFETQIFMAEFIDNKFLMYLEVITNKPGSTFRDDYKHITTIVDKHNLKPRFDVNFIKFVSDYKSLGEAILALNKDIGDKYKTDGYVFGNIKTRRHLKWKPVNKITNDFYILKHDKTIYLYVGAKITDDIRRTLNRKRNDSRLSIKNIAKYSSRDYGWVLFQEQPTTSELYPDIEWDKYDDKITECKYVDKYYVPERIREFKTNPNNIKTVKNNLKIILNPITFSDLLNHK